jgi:3D (Asp-Asp-Asp) domain-containing protein
VPTALISEGLSQSVHAVPLRLSDQIRISPQIRAGRLSALIVMLGLVAAFGGGLIHAYLQKEIQIVVGDTVTQRATYKRTVGQALAEAGVLLTQDDEVSLPLSTRLQEGARLVVRRAVPHSLRVVGKTVARRRAAPSVRDVFRRRHVTVYAQDKVYPSLDAAPSAGMTIRVVRIQHQIFVEQMEIPYQVRSSTDPATPRGIIRIKAPGKAGLKERAFKITFADGQARSRALVGERVVRNPLDRVVTIGTQVQMVSRGMFEGREVLQMVATAYSPWCCPGVDNITATGMYAGYGVVAVDPKIIPLRSRLYIEGYGYAVAGDVGSWIKGMRIDLGFATVREAIRYGRRPVRVYILHKYERKQASAK